MIRIVLPYDRTALVRRRVIEIRTRTEPGLAIPSDPAYAGLRSFLQKNEAGYRFKMLRMLHVAGVKMLQPLQLQSPKESLFATGGLYLALEQSHPDLCFRDVFGDFTGGFSHQFGVALATMCISEAYSIPWDDFVPIKVQGEKVLDYEAPLPDGTGMLQLEAKGVSGSTSAARKSIREKKAVVRSSASSPSQLPRAMVGVIVSAARSRNSDGTSAPPSLGYMEIVDPPLEDIPLWRQQHMRLAAKYMHYAGIAFFAGLQPVAAELMHRARSTAKGAGAFLAQRLEVSDTATLVTDNTSVAGFQWRLGLQDDPDTDIWFQQALEVDRIQSLIEANEFLPTRPFYESDDINELDQPDAMHSPDTHLSERQRQEERFVSSLLPDGSFFGISRGPREGLHRIEDAEIDFRRLDLIRVS